MKKRPKKKNSRDQSTLKCTVGNIILYTKYIVVISLITIYLVNQS